MVSPDGTAVVFPGTRPDLDHDRNDTQLYRVPLEGGPAVRLTREGSSNRDPAFSPDGTRVAFTSNRSGVNQVWILPGSGEAYPVTRRALGAERPVWFPDGKRLLVHGPVYRDVQDEEGIRQREDERKESPPSHRLIDSLMFRHWDAWTDDKVNHLFVVDAGTGEARDATPGPHPVPPVSLGGAPDYAVSPDGTEVCFASLRDPRPAVSTGIQVWRIPARGGEPERISTFDGANAHPAYSPDGSRIAFCGMRRAGYEADRGELLVFDRKSGRVREVAPGFDRPAGAPVWTPDGERILFAAQDRGRTRIWVVPASGGEPVPVTAEATDHRPAVTPDGNTLVFARETLTAPPEIHSVPLAGGEPRNLAPVNRAVLDRLVRNEAEEFHYQGAGGRRIHGFLLKPPGFTAGTKYPVVFLIHGGPQSAFGLDFHERWNAQLFSSRGFVTVMINPRGSTGYGQDFTDAIRGEWGGACYRDLVRGFDHVLETFPFCDRGRTAAAGASFGGYMVNWIAGQTDRFRCLVSHDGIFNTEMMEYATDELWFTEWEFGGLPWERPEEYRKWSPHRHVGSMKTPTLVVHGEQDFRCTVNEGFTFFTALQRRGVPSRLLYFADEGHWVLKPKNRRTWYGTVLDWLETYLKD